MLSKEERKEIFRQKRQRIVRTTNKKGITTEKVIAGFVNTTFEDFENWYSETVFNQGCSYCGTTNERSARLFQMQITGIRPDATRKGRRGKRLELDRRDPNQPYDNLQNVVWCCYWCNNAKSNFFTEEEFRPIALAIGAALSTL